MKFTLYIDCDNAAFGDDGECLEIELAAILRQAAEKIENGQQAFKLRDHNGNTVGRGELED